MNEFVTLLSAEVMRRLRSPLFHSGTLLGAGVLIFVAKFSASGAGPKSDASSSASMLLGVLYVAIFLSSQSILTAVAEEKTSRVAEILIGSVEPAILLAAKVAACALLAAMQAGVWICVLAMFSPPRASAGVSPELWPAFAAFFTIGYLQMSIAFAAVASLVNRTEDVGSISTPLIAPVVLAFLAGIFALKAPSGLTAVVTSFVPFLSPFVMFARIAVSHVPAWQVVLSAAIAVLAIAMTAWVGGRLYRAGMMFYGRTPSVGSFFQFIKSS